MKKIEEKKYYHLGLDYKLFSFLTLVVSCFLTSSTKGYGVVISRTPVAVSASGAALALPTSVAPTPAPADATTTADPYSHAFRSLKITGVDQEHFFFDRSESPSFRVPASIRSITLDPSLAVSVLPSAPSSAPAMEYSNIFDVSYQDSAGASHRLEIHIPQLRTTSSDRVFRWCRKFLDLSLANQEKYRFSLYFNVDPTMPSSALPVSDEHTDRTTVYLDSRYVSSVSCELERVP